jgi:uncharacterized protein YcfJ
MNASTNKRKWTAAAALGLSLTLLGGAGCQNDAQTGALIGAGAGAGIGAVVGHNTGRHTAEGAGIGAAAGAVGGYIIGNESDKSKARNRAADY